MNIGPTKANGAAPEQGRLSNLCPEGIAGGLVLVGDVDGDVANFVGSLLAPSVGERVPNVYDIRDDLGDEGGRSSDPDEGKLIHIVRGQLGSDLAPPRPSSGSDCIVPRAQSHVAKKKREIYQIS